MLNGRTIVEIKFLSYYNKLLYLSFLQLFVKPGIPVRQAGLLKNKKIKTPSKTYKIKFTEKHRKYSKIKSLEASEFFSPPYLY